MWSRCATARLWSSFTRRLCFSARGRGRSCPSSSAPPCHLQQGPWTGLCVPAALSRDTLVPLFELKSPIHVFASVSHCDKQGAHRAEGPDSPTVPDSGPRATTCQALQDACEVRPPLPCPRGSLQRDGGAFRQRLRDRRGTSGSAAPQHPPPATLASCTPPQAGVRLGLGLRCPLTLLLPGCGVQLQIVQAEAGPGREDEVPEQGPAAPAPKLHGAAVVLGDDGASAAAYGGSWAGPGQARPGLPPSRKGSPQASPSLIPSQDPGKSFQQRLRAPLRSESLFLPRDDSGVIFRTQRGPHGAVLGLQATDGVG